MPTHIPQLGNNLSIANRYGDADFLLSIYQSKFWQYLFTNRKHAWWILVKGSFKLSIEMFIFPVRMLLRYQHGSRTSGWIIFTLSLSTLVAFNSVHFFPLWATTIAWFVWFVPLFSENITYGSLISEVDSPTLFYFTCAFSLVGFVQIFGIYFLGWSNKTDKAKRGESLFFLILKRWLPKSEKFVQAFLEPLFVFALAIFFGFYCIDIYALFYFGLVAIYLFVQELLDILRQKALPV